MKIPFLVVILAMAATPVFSYSSFFDFLVKIMEEPEAEPKHLTLISRDDGEGEVFGDVDTSELDKELDKEDDILKLVEDSRKSQALLDRILSKDEKPPSLFNGLFSYIDEKPEIWLDTLGKYMEVKKYSTEDFFDKKK